MNIREKTLVVVGSALILLIAILYVTAQMELFMSFSSLEESFAKNEVQRSLNAIDNEIDGLHDLAVYWAARNDTYSFLAESDITFISDALDDGTLSKESLQNMGINLILLIDAFGQIDFARHIDSNGNLSDSPQDLAAQLSLYGFCPGCLDKNVRSSGIILLSGQTMLVVAHPIAKGRDDKYPVGRVVLGRYLTKHEVERLSEITDLNISIYALSDKDIPADFTDASAALSASKPIEVELIGEDYIAGYAQMRNIYGNPMLILRVLSPRVVYKQGLASLLNFIIVFSSAGLIFFVLTLLYLDRSVLSRLASITAGVAGISRINDTSVRLVVDGKDELTELAGSINNMLWRLERSSEELLKSERRYKAVVEDQSDLILRTLHDGTIAFANEAFCSFFDKRLEEISGKGLEHVVAAEYFDAVIELTKGITVDSDNVTYEARFQRDGGARWISWKIHGIFDKAGELAEIQGSGRDITELKNAEEALRQSERRLAEIIDFLPDPLLAINLEGRVIVWNKAMEGLTKVKALDILNKGDYEYSLPFYGFRRPILADLIISPVHYIETEYINFTRDRDSIVAETFIPTFGPHGSYLLAKAATLYNADGERVGAIESVRDMTERRIMEQKLERTRTELNIAAEIQKSFVPERTPKVANFDLAAVTFPAMEVGGDFYDFISVTKGTCGVVIADVAGKSIPAALFMALSRTIVRANASNCRDVSVILKMSNKMIAIDSRAGMFVTLMYGVLDGETRSFRYANAGHPPPIIFRSMQGECETGTANGIALGVMDDAAYLESRIEFSDGDIVALFTDGITEAMSKDGELYGKERLSACIKRSKDRTAAGIIEDVLVDVKAFTKDAEQNDDITIVILKA